MGDVAIRQEDRIGLILAVALHAILVAVLVLHRPQPKAFPIPERMVVTISNEVGLTSTSPEPAAKAAPDVAPTRGEPQPAAPAAEALPPEPTPPQPATPTKPAPAPPPPQPRAERAVAPPKPAPQPAPKPAPKPAPAAKQAPAKAAPKAATGSTATKTSTSTAASASKAATQAQAASRAPAGGSRIGSDFLDGVSGAQAQGSSRNAPAAAVGPAVRSSIASAISRQLKPHWVAPQGADAELLVTLVRFRLARDGTLAGDPQVVGQSGETPANATQKQRHAEQAIRAVRLAAPFDLPDQYYSSWQTVTSRFDRRLSQ